MLRRLIADPEGRFLVALAFPSGSVYRFDLTLTTVVPELLFSTADIPHLSHVKTLDLLHHSVEGRKLVLTERDGTLFPAGHRRVVLGDSDNDGVFESHATLDSSEWSAAGHGQDSSWSYYWNCGVVLDW